MRANRAWASCPYTCTRTHTFTNVQFRFRDKAPSPWRPGWCMWHLRLPANSRPSLRRWERRRDSETQSPEQEPPPLPLINESLMRHHSCQSLTDRSLRLLVARYNFRVYRPLQRLQSRSSGYAVFCLNWLYFLIVCGHSEPTAAGFISNCNNNECSISFFSVLIKAHSMLKSLKW